MPTHACRICGDVCWVGMHTKEGRGRMMTPLLLPGATRVGNTSIPAALLYGVLVIFL